MPSCSYIGLLTLGCLQREGWLPQDEETGSTLAGKTYLLRCVCRLVRSTCTFAL
jgi:hypothetical protein